VQQFARQPVDHDIPAIVRADMQPATRCGASSRRRRSLLKADAPSVHESRFGFRPQGPDRRSV